MKAQVKAWQGKLVDIKKEMVSRTKEKDREAKALQKAEVMRAAQGEVGHPTQCGTLHSACPIQVTGVDTKQLALVVDFRFLWQLH